MDIVRGLVCMHSIIDVHLDLICCPSITGSPWLNGVQES